MQCPNCKAPIHPSEARCPHCGAERPPRRIFGARREPFELTLEADPVELEDPSATKDWSFPLERRPDSTRQFTKTTQRPEQNLPQTAEQKVRWGGFWRRASAFLVDALVVMLLATVMSLLSYIGYKVGLAGHGQSISWETATPLLFILTCGWMTLATVYFVVFHGMEGKTIGKWILGLRVVGADQSPVTYRRALLRWVGALGFAPVGLGFLWVLWSREKRGWHDFLARTWVIRD
jgi:uncharacterized RDD family membrane protein YckC